MHTGIHTADIQKVYVTHNLHNNNININVQELNDINDTADILSTIFLHLISIWPIIPFFGNTNPAFVAPSLARELYSSSG